MNPREEIISEQLQNIYTAENEKKPAQWNRIVGTWTHSLRKIPIERLKDCFEVAAENNTKFKIPTRGQVIAAWKDVVSRRQVAGEDFSLENTRAYYTGSNLPWCYVPDDIREFLKKWREGDLSDREAYELSEFQKRKFYPAHMKEAKSLLREMRGIPDEIPTMQEFKACARLMGAVAEGKVKGDAGFKHMRQILIEGRVY